MRTEDFHETIVAASSSTPLPQFAVDSESKTLALVELSAKESDFRAPREWKLRLLQHDTSAEIPLGEEQVVDMWPHPEGRGVLLLTPTALHWVEYTSSGEHWSFAETPSGALPAVACEIRPVRPDDPLVVEETRDENRWEVALYTNWIAWAPDGTAWYALANRQYTVHRFDAATHTETHRLTIAAESNVVPRIFVTNEGLVVDHQGVGKLFLLDLRNLQPVWEVESRHATRAVGHPAHGMVAALDSGGIVAFEAGTTRVRARATPFEIARQWPDACDDRISFVLADPDPTIVKCYRDRLATFRLNRGRLEFVETRDRHSGRTPSFDDPAPQYEPQGFTYRILRQGSRLYVEDRDGKEAFWTDQLSGMTQVAPHPEDPNRVLVANARVQVLTLKLQAP